MRRLLRQLGLRRGGAAGGPATQRPRYPRSTGGTFVEEITSPAIWDRYEALLDARDDVRVLDRMLGRPRVLEWVHSVGVATDPVLRSLVPPIPPDALRQITAEPDVPVFLWTGLTEAARMLEFHGRHGRPTAAPLRVLDFGCGCGRLARFLAMRPDRWTTRGCEVNPAHVRWCRDHLTGLATASVGPLPPTPYEDGAFDLVYGLSVFTHLAEAAARAWIAELRRVLAPGGIVVLTTHGRPALEVIRDSPFHQRMFALERKVVEAVLGDFERSPFRFFRYPAEGLRAASAGGDYGSTFIAPRYVRERWTEGLELVEHLPGGLHGWQDIVVLRARV